MQRDPRHYLQRPDVDHLGVDSSATSLTGYGARLWLHKQEGSLLFNSAVGVLSPTFDVNDMGYQSRSDIVNAHLGMGWAWNQPEPLAPPGLGDRRALREPRPRRQPHLPRLLRLHRGAARQQHRRPLQPQPHRRRLRQPPDARRAAGAPARRPAERRLGHHRPRRAGWSGASSWAASGGPAADAWNWSVEPERDLEAGLEPRAEPRARLRADRRGRAVRDQRRRARARCRRTSAAGATSSPGSTRGRSPPTSGSTSRSRRTCRSRPTCSRSSRPARYTDFKELARVALVRLRPLRARHGRGAGRPRASRRRSLVQLQVAARERGAALGVPAGLGALLRVDAGARGLRARRASCASVPRRGGCSTPQADDIFMVKATYYLDL